MLKEHAQHWARFALDLIEIEHRILKDPIRREKYFNDLKMAGIDTSKNEIY